MRPDDQALDAAVRKALADQALDPSFFGTVKDLVARDSEEWRACCGSGCDPCVLVLAAAVDRARELLEPGGKSWPALPRP